MQGSSSFPGRHRSLPTHAQRKSYSRAHERGQFVHRPRVKKGPRKPPEVLIFQSPPDLAGPQGCFHGPQGCSCCRKHPWLAEESPHDPPGQCHACKETGLLQEHVLMQTGHFPLS